MRVQKRYAPIIWYVSKDNRGKYFNVQCDASFGRCKVINVVAYATLIALMAHITHVGV